MFASGRALHTTIWLRCYRKSENRYLPNDLDQPAPLRQANRFIMDEDSVNHVFSKWHTIVDQALELASIPDAGNITIC